MLFTSYTFAFFFVVVYGLYWVTHRTRRAQNFVLLAASYVFYAAWDWRFLALIIVSTLVDYGCGLLLDRRPLERNSTANTPEESIGLYGRRARRRIVFVSLVCNLGILGFFKYFDFFADSAASLLTSIGFGVEPYHLQIILPVGISFYTFQTLSYTIDIYRGDLRAHRSLLDFAVFVAFFPQLVAGPIVRAKDFLPQVAALRRPTRNQIGEGSYLVLWGLFKKVVIADNLADLVDATFSASQTPAGEVVAVAVYAFAVQIYCDFSGYTDIARGLAKLMGFELRLNFNLPYFASNPQDFWRRWHISLSTWMRDYLYVPLGGNRKGPRRTCINIMLTVVLGGLWHGAAWTFVLWGIYQGGLLMAHRVAMPYLERMARPWSARARLAGRALAVMVFFQFVCLGWLIFRAVWVGQIAAMLGALATDWPLSLVTADGWMKSGAGILLMYASPLLIMQLAQHAKNDLNIVFRAPAPARGLVYALMFYGIVLCQSHHAQPFIYFQF